MSRAAWPKAPTQKRPGARILAEINGFDARQLLASVRCPSRLSPVIAKISSRSVRISGQFGPCRWTRADRSPKTLALFDLEWSKERDRPDGRGGLAAVPLLVSSQLARVGGLLLLALAVGACVRAGFDPVATRPSAGDVRGADDLSAGPAADLVDAPFTEGVLDFGSGAEGLSVPDSDTGRWDPFSVPCAKASCTGSLVGCSVFRNIGWRTASSGSLVGGVGSVLILYSPCSMPAAGSFSLGLSFEGLTIGALRITLLERPDDPLVDSVSLSGDGNKCYLSVDASGGVQTLPADCPVRAVQITGDNKRVGIVSNGSSGGGPDRGFCGGRPAPRCACRPGRVDRNGLWSLMAPAGGLVGHGVQSVRAAFVGGARANIVSKGATRCRGNASRGIRS